MDWSTFYPEHHSGPYKTLQFSPFSEVKRVFTQIQDRDKTKNPTTNIQH